MSALKASILSNSWILPSLNSTDIWLERLTILSLGPLTLFTDILTDLTVFALKLLPQIDSLLLMNGDNSLASSMNTEIAEYHARKRFVEAGTELSKMFPEIYEIHFECHPMKAWMDEESFKARVEDVGYERAAQERDQLERRRAHVIYYEWIEIRIPYTRYTVKIHPESLICMSIGYLVMQAFPAIIYILLLLGTIEYNILVSKANPIIRLIRVLMCLVSVLILLLPLVVVFAPTIYASHVRSLFSSLLNVCLEKCVPRLVMVLPTLW